MSQKLKSSPRNVILALGSNVSGTWGTPLQTLEIAMRKLGEQGLIVKNCGDICRTTGIGGGRQPLFLNTAIIVQSHLPPATLLRFLKDLERMAGRRLGRHWGPRPLDVDIIAQAGPRRVQRGLATPRGQIVLPHPRMHERAFVLFPLSQIAPRWHHPILHKSVTQLLAQPRIQRQLASIVRLKGTGARLLAAAEAGARRNK